MAAHSARTARRDARGGFLSGRSPDEAAHLVSAYRAGLNDVGYSEGQNVSIEYRWANGDYDKLAPLAADLISRKVSVIAATGGNNSAFAAKTQTKTIPIVFTSGSDPVAVGLVASISRPERNVTGVSWFSSQLTGKGLGLLHELIPGAALVAVLVNPRDPEAKSQPSDAEAAAKALGQKLLILNAATETEIDKAFTTWWHSVPMPLLSRVIHSLPVDEIKLALWQLDTPCRWLQLAGIGLGPAACWFTATISYLTIARPASIPAASSGALSPPTYQWSWIQSSN
jgi:hypothetical protein